MDSVTSEAELPTPVETKATTTPRVPQEIIDEILEHLAADSDFRTLRSCALTSKSLVPSCRRHLFHTISFTLVTMGVWLRVFPVPEESPAHHVRHLRFLINFWCRSSPEKFFEHIPWFTNVERLAMSGQGGLQPLRVPSFMRLPQSATSFSINTGTVTLTQIRSIMMQLPNLDNLSLSGSLAARDGEGFPGVGTALRGRFSGRLRLLAWLADEDVINMLLEIPTGLHFAEIRIHAMDECLLSAVRLAEACRNTLVKLSYTVSFHCDVTWERSFDFSEFPNLQEVGFALCRMSGGLLWITTALSTLKPSTSPRLSTIRFIPVRLPTVDQSVRAVVEATGNGLQRVADEATRIQREFEGAVNVSVLLDP